MYRVRIKDKYRWDLWENDFRVVIAYSKDDAELKFTEMTGFNEHYYIESIEKNSAFRYRKNLTGKLKKIVIQRFS
nr:hypothetical protein [Escherichia coli]UPG28624.1 hypothetical protein J4W10_000075 [Escherichia coli]